MPSSNKDLEHKALIALAVALSVFLVLSASFFLVLIDKGFYDKSYATYGAYEKVGVEGVRSITDSLVSYLLGENGESSKVAGFYVFTANEQSHLEDVHSLIKAVKYLSFIAIALLALALLRLRANGTLKNDLKEILKHTGIATLAALAIIFLISLNFSWAFAKFHEVFFPQGNWKFPMDALLIILFPQQFFEKYVIRVLIHALIIAVISYLFGKALESRQEKAGDQPRKKHRHGKSKVI